MKSCVLGLVLSHPLADEDYYDILIETKGISSVLVPAVGKFNYKVIFCKIKPVLQLSVK